MTEHVPGRLERQAFHGELRAIDAKVNEVLTMVAEDLPRATDARDYERLADHAVNIARRVIYLAGHAPG